MRLLHCTIWTAVAFLMPLFLCAQSPSGKTVIYNEHRPLLYEDAFDLFPYSFLDENNEPTGFNVELVRLLTDKLDIPCIIRLKERKDVLNDMKTSHADLTMGMKALFHDEYGRYGKIVVQLFTHSVASPVSQTSTVHALQDLGKEQVIVHRNSYSHHLMQDLGWGQNAIPVDDVAEALKEVSREEKGQVLWNTASLRWLIASNKLYNMQLTAINMPHGEYKFISKDSLLLSQLDSIYAVVALSGQLESMHARWFHPEYRETGIPSWIWYLTGIIALAVLVLTYYNVSFRIRERKMRKLAEHRHKRLSIILQASHVRIWTYDATTQVFTWMDRNGLPLHRFTGLEFARLYHPEDFRKLGEGIRALINGSKEELTLELRAHDEDSSSDEEREYVIVLSVLSRKEGKPAVIIGTKCDVTDEHKHQRKVKERRLRYQSVFNTAMVDMVYYDEQGRVSQMNERAVKTFGLPLEAFRQNQASLANAINEPTFDYQHFDHFHATLALDIPASLEKPNQVTMKNASMCYELQLVPIRTQSGQLLGCYGTGFNMTDVARTYRKLQAGIVRLQKANREATDYVTNINYVLGVGGMRIVNYSPATHTLTVFKALNEVQISLTQTRCMTVVDEKSKKTAMRVLNTMDNLASGVIDAEIKTTLRRRGMQLYLQFRMIPICSKKGHVEIYFGICRDVSEMRCTQQLLEKETKRAHEVENLKNSFLRNMSYEIRTPLNAVVGFAELFEKEHLPEDEEVFVREIKNNSAYLLQLINDILFLSRLDAHMIEINKQPIDFAQTFEGHCQIGWGNDMKDGVSYVIENPYEHLEVDIDDTNLGRIIEQVAANAAQHTDQGTVRARYDYIGGKLIIAVDDTGCGMTPDTLQHIYERFTTGNHNGTGLGLPICKQLAEQMGGTIDVSSEEGKGTSVWITMPCTATKKDRKKQI